MSEISPARSQMPAPLAAQIPAALHRVEQRPLNPGAAIDARPGTICFTAPHGDVEGWRTQIMDAFGSNSIGVAQMFLRQLSEFCSREWFRDRWEPDELELIAILGLVNSVRPDNELQAALAAQMVAVHLTTMKVGAQTLRGGTVDKPTASVMARLASTFAMQCQTLDRLKGRHGRQEISVRYERHEHKHVHLEGEGS